MRLRFKDRDFTLYFDEFVRIQNPTEEIIVSPPLAYPLKPISRGKFVRFEFHPDEVLAENTTYVVQFGDAIQDITEGNPTVGLTYVFSTGDFLDSMEIAAHVVDGVTQEPVYKAWVLAYESLSDTVMRRGKPTYFTRTDSSGVGIITNVKPGHYQLYALTDLNRNYRFDGEEEMVAFLSHTVEARADSIVVHDLELYADVWPPRVVRATRLDEQLISIAVDGDPTLWTIQQNGLILDQLYIDKDTLYLFHTFDTTDILLTSDYLSPDTIQPSKIRTNRDRLKRFQSFSFKAPECIVDGDELRFSIQSTLPITAVDSQHIYILDTAGIRTNIQGLSVQNSAKYRDQLVLSWPYVESMTSIVFDSGAVLSWYASCDSTAFALRPKQSNRLSTLIVEVSQLDSAKQYILSIVNTSGQVLNEILLHDITEYEWRIPYLNPTNYVVRLVVDENMNGKQDGGWFDERVRPEPISTIQIQSLKADWEIKSAIKPPTSASQELNDQHK